MTPTLLGRWQTRLFLLGTVGLAITSVFAYWFQSHIPYLLLGVVCTLGCGWDVLYQLLQRRRWDRDWPPALQLAAGVWEALVVAWLLFGLDILAQPPTVGQFVVHYTAVWLITFLASQSLLRLIFPRWRYDGGEWF